MKLYKRMVRPYCLEAAWQGMTSGMTPLADWMDEDEKTEALEKEMEKKCKETDPMSILRWESKYEFVCHYHPLAIQKCFEQEYEANYGRQDNDKLDSSQIPRP